MFAPPGPSSYGVYGGDGTVSGLVDPHGGTTGEGFSADIGSRIGEGISAGYSDFSVDSAGNVHGTRGDGRGGKETSIIGDPNSAFGQAVGLASGLLGFVNPVFSLFNLGRDAISIAQGKNPYSGVMDAASGLFDGVSFGDGSTPVGSEGRKGGPSFTFSSEQAPIRPEMAPPIDQLGIVNSQRFQVDGKDLTGTVLPIEKIETSAGNRFRTEGKVFLTLEEADAHRNAVFARANSPQENIESKKVDSASGLGFTPDISGYETTQPGIPLTPAERQAALNIFKQSITDHQANVAPIAQALGATSLL
tara:strand:+ start:620 stop:1534 length:915 start_codon:yes stop_codon:yes gene_type:complete